ncbi:hypothetical protein ATANTOWER_000821 [Ataeniobius toweri]|uniref:Uncharacterized protein n=1 Tax=Ataeniobius toweri TaxID=208326 RepID=A0ABU7C3X9_9TELE|nr:hypothetical protein [Ataeniobius toweri]
MRLWLNYFFHLVTSPSSPWRRLEIAGSLQDWLEARRDFFPDPQIHHAIEAERQMALGEIAASMRRSPAPSSTRLSIEARQGFPAHGFAPDQPSPVFPTHNPVPGPVPEGFLNEPPPHPDPVPGPVPEWSKAEPPSHSVPVCEGLVDGLPPLPAPVPGPVLEGSEDKLPPSLVPVPEEFVEDLSPLPVPVPEGYEDAPSAPAVSRWRHSTACVLEFVFCYFTWSSPLFSVSLHPKPTPVLCFPLIVWSSVSLVPPAVQFCI